MALTYYISFHSFRGFNIGKRLIDDYLAQRIDKNDEEEDEADHSAEQTEVQKSVQKLRLDPKQQHLEDNINERMDRALVAKDEEGRSEELRE